MKKSLFFACFFAVSIISATAQDIKYGVQAGLNVAGFSGKDVSNINEGLEDIGLDLNPKPKTGFHFGGYAIIYYNEFISYQPGLYFSSRGFRINDSFSFSNSGGDMATIDIEYVYSSYYLDAPLLARVELSSGFSVLLGPQFSFLLADKENFTGSIGEVSGSTRSRNIDDVKNVDVAITIGASYDLPMGFHVSAAYDLGLRSVLDKNNLEGDPAKVYNRVFKLSVGYTFFDILN